MSKAHDELIALGNALGKPGHILREMVVQAAYDLNILANVGHQLPEKAQEVSVIKEAIERWKS